MIMEWKQSQSWVFERSWLPVRCHVNWPIASIMVLLGHSRKRFCHLKYLKYIDFLFGTQFAPSGIDKGDLPCDRLH
jgi:hypothetical protein